MYDDGHSPGFGFSSKPLFTLVENLLEWAQCKLFSLKAAHVRGIMNIGQTCCHGANFPQRSGCSTPKWFRRFGISSGGQRSTFLSPKTIVIAQSIFQRTRMSWPSLLLYAFPPVALIVKRIREGGHKVSICSLRCPSCSQQRHGRFH